MAKVKEVREWMYYLAIPIMLGIIIDDLKGIRNDRSKDAVKLVKLETKSERHELDIHALYTKIDRLHPLPHPGDTVTRPTHMIAPDRRKLREE